MYVIVWGFQNYEGNWEALCDAFKGNLKSLASERCVKMNKIHT